MARLILILSAMLSVTMAAAQDRWSIDAGMMKTWSYGPGFGFANGPLESQASYAHPSVGVSYLRKIGGHFFAGIRLQQESYSFVFQRLSYVPNFCIFGGGTDSSTATQVRFSGAYVFAAPLLDASLGRHGYWHFFVAPAAGLLVSGAQSTRMYARAGSTWLYDSSSNTSGSQHTVVLRFSAGITEHIRLNSNWHIVLTQSIGTLSALSATGGTNGVKLRPNDYSLLLGIMHKHHKNQGTMLRQ